MSVGELYLAGTKKTDKWEGVGGMVTRLGETKSILPQIETSHIVLFHS